MTAIGNRLLTGVSRARRAGVVAERFSEADLLEHWKLVGIDPDGCAYCSGQFEHLDHAYPLSRCGTPGHVLSNLVPACSRCNTSKHAMTADEWEAALKELRAYAAGVIETAKANGRLAALKALIG